MEQGAGPDAEGSEVEGAEVVREGVRAAGLPGSLGARSAHGGARGAHVHMLVGGAAGRRAGRAARKGSGSGTRTVRIAG